MTADFDSGGIQNGYGAQGLERGREKSQEATVNTCTCGSILSW